MGSLRSTDLHAALEFLEALGAAPDLDTFAGALLSGLADIIPAEIVSYNELNPVSRRALVLSRPDADAILPGATQILAEHMEDNPLVVHTARTRDGRAIKWSDFISLRQLRATELYNGLFRPFSWDRQMVTLLPAPEPLLIGVALNRSGRDFSERERDLLNLLRPHLAAAYRNAEARTLLRASEELSVEREETLVLLGPLGEPLSVTPLAARLLAAFGEGFFPEQLRQWLDHMRSRAPLPPEPLRADRAGHSVEARLLTPAVIMLRGLRARVEPDALAPLGLAPREREVLALAADGLTNAEIARRLVVGPATVKTHLEHVYEKLGVESRTAAAAVAFRAMFLG